jgi:hypothetical protein
LFSEGSRLASTLPPKVVKPDILLRDAHLIKHLEYCGIHHRRAAEVELHVFRGLVILEVVVEQALVDKSYVAVCLFVVQVLFQSLLWRAFAEAV